MFPCQVDKGKGKIKGPYEGNVEFSMEFHIIVFTARFMTGLDQTGVVLVENFGIAWFGILRRKISCSTGCLKHEAIGCLIILWELPNVAQFKKCMFDSNKLFLGNTDSGFHYCDGT